VEKYFELGLTGPVKHGVLIKVNCFAKNPSAEMRGGFCVGARQSSVIAAIPDAQWRVGE
jgi:hypothetical protein